MAYVVPGQDEDEQQQAPQQAMPKLGGSSSFGGGSAGSAPLQQGVAPATAPKSNPAQKGTGFTNLSNWLDAGKGRDQAITNKGTGLLSEEKKTFDTAADPLRNATFTGKTENVGGLFEQARPKTTAAETPIPAGGYKDPATGIVWGPKDPATGVRTKYTGPLQNQAFGNAMDENGNEVPTMAPGGWSATAQQDWQNMQAPAPAPTVTPGSEDATKQLQDMLSQEYTGPREVNYDPSAQKNLWDADSLSNANTVGSVLARPEIEQGKYTSGMQRLDDILFGADANSANASKQIGQELGAFKDGVTKEKTTLGDKVTGFDKAAKDASDKVRDELIGIGGGITKSVDDRVKAANNQEITDYNDQTQIYDPNTGKMVAIGEGQVRGGWEGYNGAGFGAGATAGNIASDDEISGMQKLSDLLGDPNIAMKDEGNYERGRATTKSSGAPAIEASRPGNSSKDLQMKTGMTAAQIAEYDRMRMAGHDEASSRGFALSKHPNKSSPIDSFFESWGLPRAEVVGGAQINEPDKANKRAKGGG